MYVPSSKSCEFSGKFMCPVAVVKSSVSKSSNAFTASHRRTVLSIEPKNKKNPHLNLKYFIIKWYIKNGSGEHVSRN